MKRRIDVGQRIRLTGKFLASTGQARGGEGQSRWTVISCQCGPCARGDWIATNETYEGEACHIARGNVEIIK